MYVVCLWPDLIHSKLAVVQMKWAGLIRNNAERARTYPDVGCMFCRDHRNGRYGREE